METSRPNVIVIITDDQGYGDLGCHGNPVASTPNLDRLHDESVRFSDFHAAPMCTPTRSQLLTGLDAVRTGAVNVSGGRSLLRTELSTMADVFRNSGYRTGLFGKWHLGDNYPYRPHDRGFEETLWFPSSHINSVPDYWENHYFDDVYCHNGVRKRYKGYCTEVFFDEAMKWIRERAGADEPFFAYLPTNAPHAPWWVPSEDREAMEAVFAAAEDKLPDLAPTQRSNIIKFLAMIRNLDGHVGRLRAFLENESLADNTLVIFMTDNGSTFGPAYYNAGMRGAKASLFEGGHRVPCFMHWPDGGFGDARDIHGVTQVQDILPTLIDLCDLTPSHDTAYDGMSLTPVLRGKAEIPSERMLMVNYSRMPVGDHPLPDSNSIVQAEGAAVLYQRWRLLGNDQLYNLDVDPGQEHNVIAEHPDIAAMLRETRDTWWEGVEPVANQIQRVIVGNDKENPMMLSACEWQDVFLDQQHQVRMGERKNSWWHLHIDRDGLYEFELRRFPRESGMKLTDVCAETPITNDTLPAGHALPVARARMMIDGVMQTKQADPDAQKVTFTQQLKAGPAYLHTWFDDERNQPLCGAYYVYVKRYG